MHAWEWGKGSYGNRPLFLHLNNSNVNMYPLRSELLGSIRPLLSSCEGERRQSTAPWGVLPTHCAGVTGDGGGALMVHSVLAIHACPGWALLFESAWPRSRNLVFKSKPQLSPGGALITHTGLAWIWPVLWLWDGRPEIKLWSTPATGTQQQLIITFRAFEKQNQKHHQVLFLCPLQKPSFT